MMVRSVSATGGWSGGYVFEVLKDGAHCAWRRDQCSEQLQEYIRLM
jgi:hypothetical protein